MQFWFILILICILLFHSFLVVLNILLCSLAVSMKSRCETKTWIVIWLSSLLFLSALFITYSPFKNKAWKGTAAVVTTAKRQKRLPLMPGKEQCTRSSLQEEETQSHSPKCTINIWWSHMGQTRKAFWFWMPSYFLSICSPVFLFMPYMTCEHGLSYSLHKSCFSLGSWESGKSVHIHLLSKTLWFLNFYFSVRLIALDILITFLIIDKLSEERKLFGLYWSPGR